jgi:hypothetical protein
MAIVPTKKVKAVYDANPEPVRRSNAVLEASAESNVLII